MDGGAWYSTLINYKKTDKSTWPFLTALIGAFIETHRERIDELLGGDADCVSVVPSTRPVIPAQQPLLRIARLVSGQVEGMPPTESLLVHSGAAKARNAYNPDLYHVHNPDFVRGKRIVLLDDSWASGATAISAAGSLLDRRAMSVVLVPIARLYNPSYWDAQLGTGNSYARAMKKKWDVDSWPRD